MSKVVELYPRTGKARRPSPDLQPSPSDLKEQIKAELLEALKHLLNGPNGGRLRKWLSPRQVREKLNVSPSALRRLRESGSIPYLAFHGEYYYDPVDVDAELRRRKRIKRA